MEPFHFHKSTSLPSGKTYPYVRVLAVVWPFGEKQAVTGDSYFPQVGYWKSRSLSLVFAQDVFESILLPRGREDVRY